MNGGACIRVAGGGGLLVRTTVTALIFIAVLACATPPTPPQETDDVLSAPEIYRELVGSLVFVQTADSSGSGVLIHGGWVVTNAHVVGPHTSARLVFADGTEFLRVPVVYTDLMGDLSLIGPLTVNSSPAILDGNEAPPVGSDVYLIGYPMESERFPQPTIVKGILSHIREWEEENITFFQTDADTVQGQSGGVLTDNTGRILGISGLAFTVQGFGMVASACDLSLRIEKMLTGIDVAGIGARRIPQTSGKTTHELTIGNVWQNHAFVFREPPGTEIEIGVESEVDVSASLLDFRGNIFAFADDVFAGIESVRAKTTSPGPCLLVVEPSAGEEAVAEGGVVRVTSNVPIKPLVDPDDGKRLALGERVRAGIDYPFDVDVFDLRLREGEKVALRVESILIDSCVAVDAGPGWEISMDDDSGGGILGLNARLVIEAPKAGAYRIVVADGSGASTGGYVLQVSAADPTAEASILHPARTQSTSPVTEAPVPGIESEESIAKWKRFFAIKPEGWVEDTTYFQEFFRGPGLIFGGGKPVTGGYCPTIVVASTPVPKTTSLEAIVDAVAAEIKATGMARVVGQDKTTLAGHDAVLLTTELVASPVALVKQIYFVSHGRLWLLQCRGYFGNDDMKTALTVLRSFCAPEEASNGTDSQVE